MTDQAQESDCFKIQLVITINSLFLTSEGISFDICSRWESDDASFIGSTLQRNPLQINLDGLSHIYQNIISEDLKNNLGVKNLSGVIINSRTRKKFNIGEEFSMVNVSFYEFPSSDLRKVSLLKKFWQKYFNEIEKKNLRIFLQEKAPTGKRVKQFSRPAIKF